MVILFFSVLIFLSIPIFSKTIIVSKKGPIATISEAINRANDKDTILIKPGEYSEGNIIVNKKLIIIGEGFPIIDGRGSGEIFTVKSDDAEKQRKC